IKNLGFKMAALSGSSISIKDMIMPKRKQEILENSQKKVDEIVAQYRDGLLTERERYNKVIDIWSSATSKISVETMRDLENDQNGFNPIFMMKDSGARGSEEQIRQMSGVRGLMIKPSGDIVELPIKSNLREGMSVLEYFTSSHGARKGLSDTALKTANAGYLTRKLIDVAQNVVVREMDCGTTNGIEVDQITISGTVIENLYERIVGRVAAENIIDPFNKQEFVRNLFNRDRL
ncbi:MAG: DNA-directed RNA polymerase subunit beta', partial [Epsilonproteobacteria bacterium]|nr:DNA-directed RNA polymerase subunit beta' [Campylobacterota bacterium]